MAVTAWKSPALGENIDRSSYTAWSNPTNIYTSNDVRADVVLAAYADSDWLRATQFGFTTSDIPSGAVVIGIEVKIERKASSSVGLRDSLLYMCLSGSTQGSDQHSSSSWPWTPEATATYGSSSSLWGWTAITDANVRDSTFGVQLSVDNYASSGRTAYVDHVQIRVHFRIPGVTEWKSPGTGETIVVPGGEGYGWYAPENITAEGGGVAENEVDQPACTTDWLRATNFGFTVADIPSGSIIQGIEVQIKRWCDAEETKDVEVYLVLSTAQQGNNQASTDTWPVALAFKSYGGAADLWGWTAVTDSNVRDATFGVEVNAIVSPTYDCMFVDYMKIRVHYAFAESMTGTLTSAGAPIKKTLKGTNGMITSWKSPGTAANIDSGGVAWGNPNNAKVEDSSYAMFDAADTYSDFLRVTNFGFTTSDIPTGAIIDGVEAQIKRWGYNPDHITDKTVHMVLSGSVQGDNQALSPYWLDSWVWATYGGAVDVWGWTGITAANVRDTAFGFQLEAQGLAGSLVWSIVDYMRIRVYWHMPGGLAGTLTSAGALIKQGQKVLAGTLTSAGALIKQGQKVLAGTLTSAGALIKKTITATVSSTREFAGLGASINDGGSSWYNTTNVYVEDGAYAYTIPFGSGAPSDSLRVTTFGLDVPVGTTILGIEVEIKRRGYYVNRIKDHHVVLVLGGVVKGDNGASGEFWPAAFTWKTYGGPTDLWGWDDITDADVRNSTFGMQISAYIASSSSCPARVDCVRIKVYYESTRIVGSLTSAGVLVKQGQKPLAGTLTSAGALMGLPQKVLVGTLTSAGALIKQGQKVLAGTLTSAGVLVRKALTAFTSTLTSAGAITKHIPAQTAAATDWKSPSLGQNVDRDGKAQWYYPERIYADDSDWSAAHLLSTYSDWLRATVFGFAVGDVPAGASVVGIEARIKRQCDVAAVGQDSALYLLLNGATKGNNKASADFYPASGAYKTYGGSADLWGWNDITDADVRDSTFGMQLSSQTIDTKWVMVNHVEIRVWFVPNRTGGVLTSAGALTKRTSTAFTGTLTSVGALIKQGQKVLAGVLTSAGALVWLPQKVLVGTLTSVGALIKKGQKPLAGTLTSAGALIKQGQKPSAGTLTSAGALIKQGQKVLAGTLTSAGALVWLPQKVLVSVLSSTGTLVWLPQKVLVGVLSSAGALTKRAFTAFVGALSSTGTLAKQGQKPFTGTLTSAGALVWLSQKVLAGTLTSAGALARLPQKVLAGVLSSAGALTKRAFTAFTGALSSVGVLAWLPQKTLAGTLTSTGALAGLSQKILAGTLTSVGALVWLPQKVLVGVLSSAGALTKRTFTAFVGMLSSTGVLIRQGQKALAGTLTSAGALTKRVFAAFTGTLTSAGVLIKQGQKVLAGTLTGAGLVNTLTGRWFVGVLTSAGTLVKQGQKPLTGTLTGAGVLIGKGQKVLAGTLTSAGALVGLSQKVLIGVLTSAGALTKRTSTAFVGALTSAGALTKRAFTAFIGTLTSAGVLVGQGQKVLAGTLSSAGALTKRLSRFLSGLLTTAGDLIGVGLYTQYIITVQTRLTPTVVIQVCLVPAITVRVRLNPTCEVEA